MFDYKFKELKLLERSKIFLNSARKMSKYFRSVEADLLQSRSEKTLEEHIAVSIYSSLKIGLMTIFLMVGLSIIFKAPFLWKSSIILGPLSCFMMFYSSIFGPRVAMRRKARLIDEELPYALRHLLIEVKSGIPLYQSLVAISDGYGECSKEIKYIVKDINAGKSNAKAIEESIIQNHSLAYRRSFWHILNALKTGTSMEAAMQATVDEIMRDQLISIKKYGQELNPWTMMYMMFGVILPSLGVAFMMILSTFAGFAIGKSMLYSMLFFFAVFQLMFVNIIKGKRPMVKI